MMPEDIKPPLIHYLLRQVDGETEATDINNPRLIARTAGRLIEEMVELALATGLPPQEILGHVTDALHNETIKARCYPTEMKLSPNREELLTEVADCSMILEMIRYYGQLQPHEVRTERMRKYRGMCDAAERGEAVVREGLFYRFKPAEAA